MDIVESSEEVQNPPPEYSADRDTEVKSPGSTKIKRVSREKNKISPKALGDWDQTLSRNMDETGDRLRDDESDFEDETVIERLIGLTEMFPENVRQSAFRAFSLTWSGVRSAYSLSRSVTWILASTATLCFLPLFLELERVQTEEQEAVQQRTLMLGPRAAGGGSGLAGFSASVPHLTTIDSR